MFEFFKRDASPYLYVSFPHPVSGRRCRKSTSRTTMKDAKIRAKELYDEEMTKAGSKERGEMSLRRAGALYVQSLTGKASQDRMANKVKVLFGEAAKARPMKTLDPDEHVSSLTTAQIEELKLAWLSAGLATRTIRLQLGVINRMVHLAKTHGAARPQDLEIKMPRKKDKARPLTDAELKRLIERLDPKRPIEATRGGHTFTRVPSPALVRQRQDNYDLTIFLVDTGARHNEVSAITWEQIDTKGWDYIDLYRSKVDNSGYLRMTSRLRKVLKRRYRETKGIYVFPSTYYGETTPKGRCTDTIRRALADIGINAPHNVKRYGTRDVRSLRDTFATRLRREGMSLDKIQGLLGHATPNQTQKYAEYAPDVATSAAVSILDRLDDAAMNM